MIVSVWGMSVTGDGIQVPVTEYTAPVPIYRCETARILSGAAPVPNSHAWTMGPPHGSGRTSRALWKGVREIQAQQCAPLCPEPHSAISWF